MYDLIVIGSGPGGYVAASRAAQLGLKTACIEKDPTLGGTCLNVGCIPSKTLLEATHFLEKAHQQTPLSSLMQRKQEVVKGLTDNVATLLQHRKVDRFNGVGTLRSPHTVEVNGQILEAKHILLATGSIPISLPFLPIDEKRIVTSTGALNLQEVPKRLTVIGGGVIGVELASVYRRLGAEVTLIEMLDSICAGLDPQILRPFQQILTQQGLRILTSTTLQDVKIGKALQITHSKGEIEADVILVAVGRKPYSEGLGLENLGIRLNPRGQVAINATFQTSVPSIYAIGDLIEGAMLAHKASEEGLAVVNQLAGIRYPVAYTTIPNVIYTEPEVAAVGLTEPEAQQFGLTPLIGLAYFKGNARARCSGETDGLVKIVGDSATGRFLGCHILGSHASELISTPTLAIQAHMTLDAFADTPFAHPTLSEALKEAAQAALKRATHG